jgi:uncharacterized protein
MDALLICVVAFLASGLTLYSGFGLGTVLLPAFALFLPVPIAVAATGVVHLLNSLFKGALLWRQADWSIIWRFGVPAIPAAIAGAWLLGALDDPTRVFTWAAYGSIFGPTAAGLVIGLLMILFALLELQPWFQRLSAPTRLMPLGGAMTGFFGGLTGQQGALRSMFLLRTHLSPTAFIATGVMIAVFVDLARLGTYARALTASGFDFSEREMIVVLAGTASAFAGAYLGTRYLKKATIGVVRVVVAAFMLLIGACLAGGIIGG